MKPKKLAIGDTVGIVAPAGIPGKEELAAGIDFIQSVGLKIKLGNHLGKINGYLAGSDAERAADINDMFADREVKAIFCARGGYGTARIAHLLDYKMIAENPKIFWGYSDITFLHAAISKFSGLVTFHGPMLTELGHENARNRALIAANMMLRGGKLQFLQKDGIREIVSGLAFGMVAGGNLTLIASTLGTPYEIDTTGRILFLEEVNEEPRTIDRMMNQLYQSGKLAAAAGIVIGDFTNCGGFSKPGYQTEEVIEHYLALAGRPAMAGVPFGHGEDNHPFPLGVHAILDTKNAVLQIEEGLL